MLVYLQITAIMCLVYSIKSKMFNTNLIGFITIIIITANSVFMDRCNLHLSISLISLIMFIVVWDFKRHISKCRVSL